MTMTDCFRDVIIDLKAAINKITNHLSGKDRYDKNLEALSMYKTALHDADNKLVIDGVTEQSFTFKNI